MVSLAREHDINLYFYLSPNHARSYEQIRMMGWWPIFEAWERELTAVLDEDAKAHPDKMRIPLWDFGGYNSVTTAGVVDVPPEPAGFRFHADSHHFKTDVSVMFLDRMFPTTAAGKIPPDFGVLLTGSNIDAHLAETNRGHEAYASANKDEVAAMSRVIESLGRLPAAAH